MTISEMTWLRNDDAHERLAGVAVNLVTTSVRVTSSPTVQRQNSSENQDIKKVIGYIRVSTLGQENEGDSLANQEDVLTVCAEKLGRRIHAMFQETGSGMGASLQKRPELEQAARMAKETGYPLICTSLDRLARNHDLVVQEILDVGIRVIDVSRGRELTESELKKGALAAQREGERIRRDTRRALTAVDSHSSAGAKAGGVARGVQISQETEDHDGEVMTIVNQIERRAGRTYNNSEMARELTRLGVPTFTKRDKAVLGTWHHHQVSRMRDRLSWVFVDPE